MSFRNDRSDSKFYGQIMAVKLKDLCVLVPTNGTLLRGALGAQHGVPGPAGSSSMSLKTERSKNFMLIDNINQVQFKLFDPVELGQR